MEILEEHDMAVRGCEARCVERYVVECLLSSQRDERATLSRIEGRSPSRILYEVNSNPVVAAACVPSCAIFIFCEGVVAAPRRCSDLVLQNGSGRES